MPAVSSDRRTYTFVLRKTFRFAPPSNAPLDAQTFRYSIERALSPKLGSDTPGIRVLGDLVGAQAFHAGRKAHVSGIRVRGDRISFTLTRPSPDFLERLALPYFCPVPRDTPVLPGGVENDVSPGAGPYTFRGSRSILNGEYAILTRNANYGGSRPQRLDAIGFREGIDTAKAVARVHAAAGTRSRTRPIACAWRNRRASLRRRQRRAARLVSVVPTPSDLLPRLRRESPSLLRSEAPESGNAGARPPGAVRVLEPGSNGRRADGTCGAAECSDRHGADRADHAARRAGRRSSRVRAD